MPGELIDAARRLDPLAWPYCAQTSPQGVAG